MLSIDVEYDEIHVVVLLLENPNPLTVRLAKFRRLALDRCVGKAIGEREKEKYHHYAGTDDSVIPLVASSGGCLGHSFRKLIEDLCNQLDPDARDIGQQHRFATDLIGHLSIVCVRAMIRLAYGHSSPRRALA